MRVAAIDCGTNSLRLLIADADDTHSAGGTGGSGRRLREVVRRVEVVRLGQGVDATGRLDPAAIERTLTVTEEYAAECARRGVERMRFVATSAVRDASNAAEFVDGVRRSCARAGTGAVVPEIVSGREEALLSFTGATGQLSATSHSGPYLVVDLGGGSTELVLGITEPTAAISLDIGSVRLSERHGILDASTPAERLAAAQADVDAALDSAAHVVDLGAVRTLVGVAGTVTTLTAAALGLDSYQRHRVDQAHLSVVDTLAACTRLLAMPAAERAELGYMQPGRGDVIGAGALIWRSIVERVRRASGVEHVVTSESDILDGIALSIR